MAVDQLPGRVREFANYLDGLLGRLDQGGGWCGVFWQRDPEGMQACLDGREVSPWDVVEALLQDLHAAFGPAAAAAERERARVLHSAAVSAYDARPGARDALRDRLDVMLREQRYAAERQAELNRLLTEAPSREEADALRLDLAWAHDDHERATARCAELQARMVNLDRRAVEVPLLDGAEARGAGEGGVPGPGGAAVGGAGGPGGSGAVGFGGGGAVGDGGASQASHGGFGGAVRASGDRGPLAPGADGYGGAGAGGRSRTSGAEGFGGAAAVGGGGAAVPGGMGAPGAAWRGAASAPFPSHDARVADHDGRFAASTGDSRDSWFAGPVADHAPRPAAPHTGQVARQAGVVTGPSSWPAASDADPVVGRPESAVDPASRPAVPDAGPAARQAGSVMGPSPWPAPSDAGPEAGQGGSVTDPAPWPARADAGPAARPAGAVTGPAVAPPAAHPTHEVSPVPAPEAPTPAKPRKRRRGSARFAGMVEDAGAPVAVPQAPVAAAPEAAAGRRTPRGARFAGATEGEAVEGPVEVAVDAEAGAAVVGVVEELVRLRGEGRTGEAHVLLVEIARWPAARFPLLADRLQHAGLGADWATLLWEAASLPAERLVAAADALEAAGRLADGQEMLRQGVARPAEEIGAAVLGLDAEGRGREVRALLDAYVRVRTPEEAARSAGADPRRLVPLLLEAARGVSEERHWDLVHALRVAGFTA
ncbi:hypothetical protein [Streptomyces sp. NPDC101165]|uniref:hypothetical protein n=1 Tax=Streptomyces sp. NPDC101165 TaxID=3366119 RepID=UPI0038102EE1